MCKKKITLFILIAICLSSNAFSQSPDSCMFFDSGVVSKKDSEYVNKKLQRIKSGESMRYMNVNYNVFNKDTMYLCLPTGYQIGFRVTHRSSNADFEDISFMSLTSEKSEGYITIKKDGVSGIFRDRIQETVWTIFLKNKFQIIITNSKGAIHKSDDEIKRWIKRGGSVD